MLENGNQKPKIREDPYSFSELIKQMKTKKDKNNEPITIKELKLEI